MANSVVYYTTIIVALPDGSPAKGVSVSVGGRDQGYTDGSGRLIARTEYKGKYSIHIKKSGYPPISEEITVGGEHLYALKSK
jgi:hypothetical protein